MSIFTRHPESGKRPLSTADLAAASRGEAATEDSNDEPVVNQDRPSPATAQDLSEDRTATGAGARVDAADAEARAAADVDPADSPRRQAGRDMSAGRASRAAAARDAADRSATEDGSNPPAVDATADVVEAEVVETQPVAANDPDARSGEALEPLFAADVAETYRSRWNTIQSDFVDDPRRAVRSGDELVAQVMSSLANSFADERHRVEAQLDQSGEGSTENLRVALRRYRSFFERLLSL